MAVPKGRAARRSRGTWRRCTSATWPSRAPAARAWARRGITSCSRCVRPCMRRLAASPVTAIASWPTRCTPSCTASRPPARQRTSLLAWFHGRSRLVTWLRSVLVQRHIDARRAASRIEQWDGDEDRAPLPSMSGPGAVPDPGRGEALVAIQEALDAAIAGLDAEGSTAAPPVLRRRPDARADRTCDRRARGHGVTQARARQKGSAHARGGSTCAQAHGLSDQAIAEFFAQAADAPELHLTRLLSRAEDG